MEGTFATASKRKKLLMNNRKANFVLGSSIGRYTTTNSSCYVSSSVSPSPRNTTNQILISHINFGKVKENHLTENLTKYQSPSPDHYYQKTRYKSETPNNIITGNYPTQFIPSSKDYKTPAIHLHSPEVKTKPNVTRHNHELGTEKVEKISTTHKEFTPYKLNPIQKIFRNGHVSRLKLGGHPGNYKSEASASLTVKEHKNQSIRFPDMKKVHFSLGTDPVKFISTQQGYHKELQKSEKAEVSHYENLKKSHFSFNSESPDYTSEARLNLRYSPAEPRTIEKYFKENHVSFGDGLQLFSTSYAEAHSPKGRKSLDKSIGKSLDKPLDKPFKPDTSQGLALGQNKSPLVSTHNLCFKGEKASPGRLESRIEKSLKSSHFSIGNSEKLQEKHIKTEINEILDSQIIQKLEKPRFESKSIDLRKSHWTFGSHLRTKTSTMQNHFKAVSCELRSPEDYLKKQNFVIGRESQREEDWRTCYNNNFKWIQPIPED